jgi:hypothetical protein
MRMIATIALRTRTILLLVMVASWSAGWCVDADQPDPLPAHRQLVDIVRSADECERDWLARQDHRQYGIAMRRLCEEVRRCEPFMPAHGVLLVALVRRVVEKEVAELLPFKRAALLMVMNGLPASPKEVVHDRVWYRTAVGHLACAVMQQARIHRDAAFVSEQIPADASAEEQARHEKRVAAARRIITACDLITTGLPESFRLFVAEWYARGPVDVPGAGEACMLFGLTRTQQAETLSLLERRAASKVQK